MPVKSCETNGTGRRAGPLERFARRSLIAAAATVVATTGAVAVTRASSAEAILVVLIAVSAAAVAFMLGRLDREPAIQPRRADDLVRRGVREAEREATEQVAAHVELADALRTAEPARTRDELAARQAADPRRPSIEHNLAEVQRIETVGRMAGGVVHDVNNLLTVISGNVEFLLDHGGVEELARDELGEVMVAVGRASRLLRELLALGRRELAPPRPTSISEVIGGVRRMAERVTGAGIELRIEGAGDQPIVAHVAQLEQVVINLVLNARDAMPGGGTLTLRSRRCDVAAAELGAIAGAQPGPYAVLEVIDTGVGMNDEVRRSIFEPFFTTKPSSQGSGLGLPAVAEIVAQHGGFVDVTSAVGRGSVFAVHLPIANERPRPRSRTTVPPVRHRQPASPETAPWVADQGSGMTTA